jgi:hypothetical protein
VFKDAQDDRIKFAAALRVVKQARRQSETIRGLLRKLGDVDEHRSLNDRFRRTKQRLESGARDAATAAIFAELSLAVHALGLLAHKRFYTKVESR